MHTFAGAKSALGPCAAAAGAGTTRGCCRYRTAAAAPAAPSTPAPMPMPRSIQGEVELGTVEEDWGDILSSLARHTAFTLEAFRSSRPQRMIAIASRAALEKSSP